MCGSSATLRIESPGDRTYAGLYTEIPGAVRLDVYRNGELYWSGTLDPEFYEEPYERSANYPVELTFTDFGQLDRIPYDGEGLKTLKELVVTAIGKAGVNAALDDSLISTQLDEPTRMGLGDLSVRSDNFYDEDGEALTWKEVLEGILQPLGLRMEQRAGAVYVYDLNSLYNGAERAEAVWDGDSQTMSTDVVYNNANVTWSPYAEADELLSDKCWTEPTDPNTTNVNNPREKEVGDCFILSHRSDNDMYEWTTDTTDVGFTIWTSLKGEKLTLGDSGQLPPTGPRFFKIVPQFDGDESEGVALRWVGVSGGQYNPTVTTVYGVKSIQNTGQIRKILFRSEAVVIPPGIDADTSAHGRAEDVPLCLRITLETLLDHRYNPFEDSVNSGGIHNQESTEKKMKSSVNFYYVPVGVKFKAANGEVYTWFNHEVLESPRQKRITKFADTFGQWARGDAAQPQGFLVYYDTDPDKRKKDTPALGWAENRPGINPHDLKLDAALRKFDTGQYIPWPKGAAAGGELWLEVYDGWMLAQCDKSVYPDQCETDHANLWNKMLWVLCKPPQIEILNRQRFDMAIDTDDVEYSAVINPNAKEDIDIDTICGTSAEGIPTARGAYFRTSDYSQVTELTRAGRTAQVEELLIGTLFSQFGERHTVLAGDMRIADGPLRVFTEQNQGERVFMLTADVQRVIEDVSEAELTELRPDEYDKKD